MGTDVRVEIVIHKLRSDVAAFMFDPRNDSRWTSGVIGVFPLDEGRLRAGSRVERQASFLGRHFSYQYQVVDARGDERIDMVVKQPFPMRIRYQLEAEGGDTRVSIHAQGDAGGFYKLAAPFLTRMVKRSISRDLQLLKECLETV